MQADATHSLDPYKPDMPILCVPIYISSWASFFVLFVHREQGVVHHHVSKAVRRATPAAAKAWGEVPGLIAGMAGGIGGRDVPT